MTHVKKYGIVAIGYNRPDSMRRLLTALEASDYQGHQLTLIVSIDNCGNNSVEQMAKTVQWSHGEKIIRTFPERQGLRNHILQCGSYMEIYDLDAIAVFEDDVVPSPVFFSYMAQCTERYSGNDDIAGISLYKHGINVNADLPFQPQPSQYDVFFMQFAQSWGQVWLRKQWKAFSDWYASDENDHVFDSDRLPAFVCGWPKTSWLKYHIKYCVEKNKYFVYPYFSYATCFSEAGEHTGETTSHLQVPVQTKVVENLRLPERTADGVRYDVYFEYEDGSDVCYDLYGTKQNYGAQNKLLTCKHLPYQVIDSYAMLLKPHEMNYLNKLSGNNAFLYDLTQPVQTAHCGGLGNLGELNYYYNYFPNAKTAAILLRQLLQKKTDAIIRKIKRR